jgi:hypothetical protein
MLIAPMPTACSAEAVEEPDPSIIPGAFLAVRIDNEIRLYRVLSEFTLTSGTRRKEYLFVIDYANRAASFNDARQLAQRRDLQITHEDALVERVGFLDHPWEVVWYRSLTPEELAAIH